MSSLLVFGAGGHGKVVADTARAVGGWNEIMFADDAYPQLTSVDGYPVIADFSGARSMAGAPPDVIVAIGDNRKRSELTTDLRQSGCNPVTLVHPSAVVAQSAHIGAGTVIFAQAVVQAAARIGSAVIVNTAATVDHDCSVGDGAHLSPGVRLGGEVQVGDYSWLGVGAVVINRTAVGREVTVGAGSCVIGNLPDGVTVVGVPARPIRQDQPGD